MSTLSIVLIVVAVYCIAITVATVYSLRIMPDAGSDFLSVAITWLILFVCSPLMVLAAIYRAVVAFFKALFRKKR